MQHFYDGQIRRYLTQIMRIFGQFSYKDGKGQVVQIPITYGDLTRQVGSIIRDNSENKIPSAPRMALYITGLEMDTSRLSDSSYVNKLNIRERALNAEGNEYLNTAGKNYTVERLMPTPYTLTVNIDVWSTNTDQKLQILEQIFMLFNPSLEIQTTDNYIDWTSLSVLNMDNINFSSRSIPNGVDSEIDIATLTLTTPIYISPPAKVKKLGVITKILTAVFADSGLEVNIQDDAYAQSLVKQKLVSDLEEKLDNGERIIPENESRIALTNEDALIVTAYQNYDLLVLDNGTSVTAKLLKGGVPSNEKWTGYLAAQPITYEEGTTELRLQRSNGLEIVSTIAINADDETELILNVDSETLPDDTVITSPNASSTNIDFIIDPTRFDPRQIQDSSSNARLLLLGPIGDPDNTEGPLAWKNSDDSDFTADENDIVEWDGNNWSVVFNASESASEVFVTNLNTQTQYKWTGEEWILSYEGEYSNGTWRLSY